MLGLKYVIWQVTPWHKEPDCTTTISLFLSILSFSLSMATSSVSTGKPMSRIPEEQNLQQARLWGRIWFPFPISLFIPILYIPSTIHTSYTVKLDYWETPSPLDREHGKRLYVKCTILEDKNNVRDKSKFWGPKKRFLFTWGKYAYSLFLVPGVGSIVMFAWGEGAYTIRALKPPTV